MLPDPILYSELESLSSLRHFLDLALDFLIAFSSLSNFSVNWAKDCLAGLGFFQPFLVAWKLAFSDPSFSNLWQSFVLCIVCVPPCFLQRSWSFSKWTFLGTLVVDPVLGNLFPVLLLLDAFLPECALNYSCAHTCSIASSEMVLCPILWGINIHIFMPMRLDEISNSIVDTHLKFVCIYQKKIGLVYTYFFW